MIRFNVLCVGLLLFAMYPAKGEESPTDSWQVVEAGGFDDLRIRFKVQPRACAADEEWMGIEFDNLTSQPINIRHLNFRLDKDCTASGTDHSLFPEAWETRPVGPRVLKPGKTINLKYVSDYCTALMALPGPEGAITQGTFHIDLTLEDDRHFSTPVEGVPFSFEWYYPGEEDFERMRELTRSLLTRHSANSGETYRLLALLKMDIIPVGEAIAALPRQRKENPSTGFYWALLEYLRRFKPGEPEVVDYIRGTIVRRDNEAFELLREWDPSYAVPLLAWLREGTEEDIGKILRFLDYQYSHWVENAEIKGTIKYVVQSRIPLLTGTPESLDENDFRAWVKSANLAGITRDLGFIPLLEPYLDDTRIMFDASMRSDIFYPLDRVCDVALIEILKIKGAHDSSYHEKYRPLLPGEIVIEEPKETSKPETWQERFERRRAAYHKDRDRLIALYNSETDPNPK